MVKPKASASASSSKKPKKSKSKAKAKGGVDFKKYKHHVGRKLPPPKNATNTQIKSKAIVLPEQSMASERAGMAINKRGLTLRELLQQTSHHNANVRKAALNGIKDLVLKHPQELQIHKIAILEKLRQIVSDNERGVRDTLYSLLQGTIFPSLKEDMSITVHSALSELTRHVVHAICHQALEIRLMGFKFLELVVLNYPSCFFAHSEQVLDNYIAMLDDKEIYLHDRSKLYGVVGTLVHCLALVASKRAYVDASKELTEKFNEEGLLSSLQCAIPEDNSGNSPSFMKKLEDLIPLLIRFVQHYSSILPAKSDIGAQSSEALQSALQCLNLICKIFNNEVKKPQMKFGVCKSVSYRPDLFQSTMLVNFQALWTVKHLFDKKEDIRFFALDAKIAEIILCLSDLDVDRTFPMEKFPEFIISLLQKAKMSHSKELVERHLAPLLTSIPRLVSKVASISKGLLLEAFTDAFKNCNVDSELILGYLAAIEEMLLAENFCSWFSAEENQEFMVYRNAWLHELPGILLQSVDKNLVVTKVVLKLLLEVGKHSLLMEYDNLCPLINFYGVKNSLSNTELGPFVKLPRDCQEVAICCVYYFSYLLPDILESLALSCLYGELEPSIIFRIVEVLQSAYRAGHLQISEQVGFLLSLIARFKVYPEKLHAHQGDGEVSNWKAFKSLNHVIFTFLSEMGDGSLVLELLWKYLFSEIERRPSAHNMSGLLRTVVALDARTTRLSENDANNLSNWVAGYMVDVAFELSGNFEIGYVSDKMKTFQYFMKPCIVLFDGNDKILVHALEFLGSFVMGEKLLLSCLYDMNDSTEVLRRVYVVTSILILLYKDARLHKSLSSSEPALKVIMQNMRNLLDSKRPDVMYDQNRKVRSAFDQLVAQACQIHTYLG